MKTFSIIPQVFVALAAYVGAFYFGIALGWPSPVVGYLKGDRNIFDVSNNQFAWIVALMPLGASFGTAVTGLFRKKFGTKYTFVLMAIPTTVGWLLLILSKNAEMLMAGRFLTGVSGGSCGILLPLYIGEISSKEIRGSLLSLFQIFVNFGEIFVFTVGYFADFLLLNILCGVIPLLYATVALLLPESPVFLVGKGKNEEAERSIQLLRGKKYNCVSEMDEIKKQYESSSDELTIVQHLKEKPTRKAFLIILAQFFFFQFTGINAILAYTTTIFLEAGIQLDAGIASIIVVSSQIIGTSFSTVLVDKFGRRGMMYVSTVLMTLSHTTLAVYFVFKDSGRSLESFGWVPIVSLSVFEIAFGCGIGSVPYILLGELFTPAAKKVVAPIGKSFNLVLAAIVSLTFPYLVEGIGNAGTFFFFAGFSVLACIYTFFFIPETKGKSLAEIQDMLN